MGQIRIDQDMAVQDKSHQVSTRPDSIGQDRTDKETSGQVSPHHKNQKTTSKQFDVIVISLLERSKFL